MEDKRIRQLTLPLELSKRPEFKDIVKQHWNVTFARQKKVSVCAKRIMGMVLAQIRDNDGEFKPFYQMRVGDVVTAEQSTSSAYKEVKKAFKELSEQVWYFEDLKNKKFVPRNLLDTTKVQDVDGFETSYNQGVITVVINPALKDYFLQLAHYTTYELNHYYMNLKSWYSMRIYEILSAYRDSGWWRISIDEYRQLMDCKKKYPDTRDLIDRTLTEPKEELKTTKLAFSYEPIYDENKVGKGRKPIVGLQLELLQVEPTTIDHLRGKSSEHNRILDNLQKFKVTDQNIIRYIRAIGAKRAKELLREWQLKELSKDRIDDRAKYCNKIWVAEGKKALKAKTELAT